MFKRKLSTGRQEIIYPGTWLDPTRPGELVDQLETWLDEYRVGTIALPGTCRVSEREVKRLSARTRRAVLELETHWVQIDYDWTQYKIAEKMAMRGVLDHDRGPAEIERSAGIVLGLGRNALVLGWVGVLDPRGGGRSTIMHEPSVVRKAPEGYKEAIDLLKGTDSEERVFNIVDADIGRLPLGDS